MPPSDRPEPDQIAEEEQILDWIPFRIEQIQPDGQVKLYIYEEAESFGNRCTLPLNEAVLKELHWGWVVHFGYATSFLLFILFQSSIT